MSCDSSDWTKQKYAHMHAHTHTFGTISQFFFFFQVFLFSYPNSLNHLKILNTRLFMII